MERDVPEGAKAVLGSIDQFSTSKLNQTKGRDMKESSGNIIDRPDAPDIFCDGALGIGMRHNMCRITLHSDRIDASDGKTVNRVVIGNLAMPPTGFVDLYNKMSGVMEQLKKAGLVQAAVPSRPQ
jgi:hypothetical protein